MQNLLRFAGDVAVGGPPGGADGRAAFPFVDTRDVGAAVAAVLRDPAAHAGATYALTGPSAVTYAEIAAALSDARRRGRSATSRSTRSTFRAGLLDAGIPQWRADDLAAIASAYTAADNAVDRRPLRAARPPRDPTHALPRRPPRDVPRGRVAQPPLAARGAAAARRRPPERCGPVAAPPASERQLCRAMRD